jgi:hypothetical protein
MPGYPWMFSGNAAQPNVDARDLVAYVRSLGRERSLAGEAGGEQVDHGTAMEMSSRYGAQAEPDTKTHITGMGLDASAPIFSFAQSSDAIRLTHGKGHIRAQLFRMSWRKCGWTRSLRNSYAPATNRSPPRTFL